MWSLDHRRLEYTEVQPLWLHHQSTPAAVIPAYYLILQCLLGHFSRQLSKNTLVLCLELALGESSLEPMFKAIVQSTSTYIQHNLSTFKSAYFAQYWLQSFPTCFYEQHTSSEHSECGREWLKWGRSSNPTPPHRTPQSPPSPTLKPPHPSYTTSLPKLLDM